MVNFSYGNSKAAIKLEQILEEMGSTDPKTKSYKIKVGSIINDCNVVLNAAQLPRQMLLNINY